MPTADIPEKLKIALVCDWFLPQMGGVEMHLGDLAPRLARAGHRVHVITPIPGPQTGEGYRVHRLDVPLFPKFRFVCTRSAFRRIADILERENFDVVHCHGNIFSPTAYGTLYLAQKRGIPALITWHSILGPYRWALRFLDWVFRWSRWPVLFSAVSGVVAEGVRTLVEAVHVLPNGMDVAAWRTEPKERPAGVIRLVSVMRLYRKKRAKALVAMLPGIVAALPKDLSLNVQIVGEGPDRAELARMIRSLELEDTVELLGHKERSEILAIFARADLYVQPTIWESFGLAALEARCAGLPVVARSQGGVREIVGEGGLYGETDRDVQEQILRLIEDEPLRRSIAKRNRETTPPLDWSDVLARHEVLYRQAIEKIKT